MSAEKQFPDQLSLARYKAQMWAQYPQGIVALTAERFDDEKLRKWHEASKFAAAIVNKRDRRKRKEAQPTLF